MTGLVSGPIVWKYGACVGSGTFRGGGGYESNDWSLYQLKF